MNSCIDQPVSIHQSSSVTESVTLPKATPLIEIKNLSIHSASECIVSDLSMTLENGKPVTILGETGSGKSLLAQAIMGALPKGLSSRGSITRFGCDHYRQDALEQLWGRRIAMLPQEPWLSLDPIMAGKKQISLVEHLINGKPETEAENIVLTQMAELGLKGDEKKVPDQLSGGMAQRLAYLCATAAGAEVLIADEPTKGLDASRKSLVIDLLQKQSKKGALLTITHDIGVAGSLGGNLIVMRQGNIVEQGRTQDILQDPASRYGKALIAAQSPDYPKITKTKGNTLITASQLTKRRGGKVLFSNLNLSIAGGEVVGLSGDSGSGKSTLADTLLGLVKADKGSITRSPTLTRGKMLKLYQDPPAAFPQTITLGQNLRDLCRLHKLETADTPDWLAKLRLDQKLLDRKPAQVSGGELQRFALVRALMMKPRLLVADEPVSRLDPIVASETLALLVEHTQRIGCALLLASHDLVAMKQICDKIISLED